MNKLATVLAVVATATLAAPAAQACGEESLAHFRPQHAEGSWSSIARTADADTVGFVTLELAYPRFAESGVFTYIDSFDVLDDDVLRRLERRAARPGQVLMVDVEELMPGMWHVTGWHRRRS